MLIVGGGLVGLSQALLLARQGQSVTLINEQEFRLSEPEGLNIRGLALSWSSRRIFERMQVWQELEAEACPIEAVQVSRQGSWGQSRLKAADYAVPALGYVIGAHRLGRVLLEAARQDQHIDILSATRLLDFSRDGDAISVRLQGADGEQQLQADWLLAADGGASMIRERLSVSVQEHDYRQVAIVANVSTSQPNNGCAFERFTHEGPLALLPIGPQSSALVWTQSPESAERRLGMSDEAFLQQLQSLFGFRLGRFEALSARSSQSLRMTLAQSLGVPRCLLLGNAAATLHPVAGQGLNLALRDAETAADLLQDSNLTATDLFNRYQAQRLPDRQRVIQSGHALVQVFSRPSKLVSQALAAALLGIDVLPALKHEIAWQGMGLRPNTRFSLRPTVSS